MNQAIAADPLDIYMTDTPVRRPSSLNVQL